MQDLQSILDSYKDCTVTFVGSRKVTRQGLSIGLQAKEILLKNQCIFRSGNALGFDQIVSMYVPVSHREIYLPYQRFGPAGSELVDGIVLDTKGHTYAKAQQFVYQCHPCHEKLKQHHLCYLIRDVYQVLGKDLQHPSSVVVCWTPDGAETAAECTRQTGGTGMAIRIANAFGIPVVNLKRQKEISKLEERENEMC